MVVTGRTLAALAGAAATLVVVSAAAQPQGEAPAVVEIRVLPPPRPANLRAIPAPVPAASPGAPLPLHAPAPALASMPPPSVAAAPPAASPPAGTPARTMPQNERDVVDRANAFFNAITGLKGDFTQIGGDGRRLSGQLHVQRPGKVRFDYDAPATLDVISDGTSVAVRDRKLATQDLYPLSQTPLKFLVGERIELGKTIRVAGVERTGEEARIELEDRSTLGGTSRITLSFDPAVENLKSWRIVDPQGFETLVILSNLERVARVDQRLFVINYQRMLGEGSAR